MYDAGIDAYAVGKVVGSLESDEWLDNYEYMLNTSYGKHGWNANHHHAWFILQVFHDAVYNDTPISGSARSNPSNMVLAILATLLFLKDSFISARG